MRKCGAVKEMRDLDVVLAHVDTALAHLHTTNHKAFEALDAAADEADS
jgi:CHAD domain-containing protein